MEYKWDKKYIKRLFQEHPEAKENLECLYRYLKDPLGLTGFTIYNPIAGFMFDYNYFMSKPDVKQSALDFAKYEPLKKISPFNSVLSTDEVLTLTHDFYKQVDPELFKHFLNHWNQRYTHLQVSRKKLLYDYSGEAFCNPETNDYFAYISKQDSIEMARIYTHECGHMISKSLNYQINKLRDIQVISPNEIESIFMEMVFTDYLDQIPDFQHDSRMLRKIKCNNIIDQAYDVYFSYRVIDEFEEYFNNPEIEFLDTCKKAAADFDISLIDFIRNLQKPAAYEYDYFLSSIYALSLYNLYQTEPDRAIAAYKVICASPVRYDEEKLKIIEKLGINPVNDFGSYARKLER